MKALKTNSTIVRKQVTRHVLDQIESVEILAANMNAAADPRKHHSTYQKALNLVEIGEFEIYDVDKATFLNSTGINPEDKDYSVDAVRHLYGHLVSIAIVGIVELAELEKEVEVENLEHERKTNAK